MSMIGFSIAPKDPGDYKVEEVNGDGLNHKESRSTSKLVPIGQSNDDGVYSDDSYRIT